MSDDTNTTPVHYPLGDNDPSTDLNQSHMGGKGEVIHSTIEKSITSMQIWGTGGDNPPSGGSAIVAAPQPAQPVAAATAPAADAQSPENNHS